MSDSIYLDNNATTRLAPEVREAIHECLGAGYVNPASQHRLGRQARTRLDDARESITQQLGCSAEDQLIFCSGGTEANNTAIQGLGAAAGGHFITSKLEHPSVTRAFDALQRQGHEVSFLRATSAGEIDLDHLRQLISPRTSLVSVMYANHETGVVQPVEEVAAICREAGVLWHCDAAQAVGKCPLSFAELGADAMTVVPHKFHGPVGIGGLVLREGRGLRPLLWGGSQQLELRPGTENVALAVGFDIALGLAEKERETAMSQVGGLRDGLESHLSESCPELEFVGRAGERLATTSCISFQGVDRQAMLMALDLAGVACSTGSACASGSSEPSPVLLAMGLPATTIEGALRFSLSRLTEAAEVASASDRISIVFNNLRQAKQAKK